MMCVYYYHGGPYPSTNDSCTFDALVRYSRAPVELYFDKIHDICTVLKLYAVSDANTGIHQTCQMTFTL